MTRLKCCACHEKWRWTRRKCCACHENCNTSCENVAKVLRLPGLPHKTTFDTLQNTSECHEVPRLPRESETSKNDPSCRTYHRHGPHTDGCGRFANGCGQRTVERTHPQPPDPQSETGTLATQSGKNDPNHQPAYIEVNPSFGEWDRMSEIPCVSVKSIFSNGKATTFAGEIPTVSYLDNNWLITPQKWPYMWFPHLCLQSHHLINELTMALTAHSIRICLFGKRHVVQSRRRLCSKCAKSHPVVPCDTWATRATPKHGNGRAETARWQCQKPQGLMVYTSHTSGKGYVGDSLLLVLLVLLT